MFLPVHERLTNVRGPCMVWTPSTLAHPDYIPTDEQVVCSLAFSLGQLARKKKSRIHAIAIGTRSLQQTLRDTISRCSYTFFRHTTRQRAGTDASDALAVGDQPSRPAEGIGAARVRRECVATAERATRRRRNTSVFFPSPRADDGCPVSFVCSASSYAARRSVSLSARVPSLDRVRFDHARADYRRFRVCSRVCRVFFCAFYLLLVLFFFPAYETKPIRIPPPCTWAHSAVSTRFAVRITYRTREHPVGRSRKIPYQSQVKCLNGIFFVIFAFRPRIP